LKEIELELNKIELKEI